MRTCANNNCETSLDGMKATARYCSAACRVAGWRQREGVTGYKAVRASQYARRRASGRQVSYRRAVEVVATYMAMVPPEARSRWTTTTPIPQPDDYRMAAEVVARELPDRQRKSLEQREAA